jgi:YHS domain-containing protein
MWMTIFMCFALVCAHNYRLDPSGEEAAGHEAARQQGEATVVPLEGLDPVLLAGGKETQGDEQFSVTRGQFRYFFAGAETKAAFEKEPGRYEIQLGGSCARMGPTVRGNPDLFLVHGGRIYIFGSEECVTAFKAKPESFLDTGAGGEQAPATEEARRRGRALVEKAIEAAGGGFEVNLSIPFRRGARGGASYG